MTQAQTFLSAAASRLPANIRVIDDRASRALLTDGAKFTHALTGGGRQFVFEDGSRVVADCRGECVLTKEEV
jgi:hypothetical protein